MAPLGLLTKGEREEILLGTSFVPAVRDSTKNVLSSVAITSLSAEQDEKSKGLKSALQGAFGPLARDIKLRHIETRQFSSGLVQSTYEVAE